MKIDLTGKLALVTGSSKGIGFATAKILAESGARVILLSRNKNNLETAANKIKETTGEKPDYIIADLSKREDLFEAVEKLKKIGNPDIFFFSTGGPKPGFFMDKTFKDWEEAANLLLYPPIYIIKSILPSMINKKYGRIILSTSITIKEPIPSIALSDVIRISMAGLVKTLSKEVGIHNITVNGILPGIIETERMIELTKEKAKTQNISFEQAYNTYLEPIPSKRAGKPEEIGYLATFLASDFASYINGSMIPVDGGRLSSVF